jgi:hypothetical protein
VLSCAHDGPAAPYGIGDARDPARSGVPVEGLDELRGHLDFAVSGTHPPLIAQGSQRRGDLVCLLEACLDDHLEHLMVELWNLGYLRCLSTTRCPKSGF